eukprot:5295124-Pleurochrysis_carterae.AAC.3
MKQIAWACTPDNNVAKALAAYLISSPFHRCLHLGAGPGASDCVCRAVSGAGLFIASSWRFLPTRDSHH